MSVDDPIPAGGDMLNRLFKNEVGGEPMGFYTVQYNRSRPDSRWLW